MSSAISHLKEDFETAWASGSGVTRKHFKDKIFIILWARHPETLAEKEQIRNELEFFSKLYPKTIKIDPDY